MVAKIPSVWFQTLRSINQRWGAVSSLKLSRPLLDCAAVAIVLQVLSYGSDVTAFKTLKRRKPKSDFQLVWERNVFPCCRGGGVSLSSIAVSATAGTARGQLLACTVHAHQTPKLTLSLRLSSTEQHVFATLWKRIAGETSYLSFTRPGSSYTVTEIRYVSL